MDFCDLVNTYIDEFGKYIRIPAYSKNTTYLLTTKANDNIFFQKIQQNNPVYLSHDHKQ